MTDEEAGLIWSALWQLHSYDPRWGKNIGVFRDMSALARLRWWERAKKQAELGVPSMRMLVAEVIKLRMTT